MLYITSVDIISCAFVVFSTTLLCYFIDPIMFSYLSTSYISSTVYLLSSRVIGKLQVAPGPGPSRWLRARGGVHDGEVTNLLQGNTEHLLSHLWAI